MYFNDVDSFINQYISCSEGAYSKTKSDSIYKKFCQFFLALQRRLIEAGTFDLVKRLADQVEDWCQLGDKSWKHTVVPWQSRLLG
mmetsp:Transcript_10527/g.19934  ORF Transcript_10527/g.19934 Transcript_10527/m.19934 type:complete len:85 (-) Transcript_10527:1244-1498(-)